MKPNYKNFKILILILHSWMKAAIGIAFCPPSSYLSRITSEEPFLRSLSKDELILIKKTVKGVNKLSILFVKKRKCLMDALVVFHTLKKFGISPTIKLGTKVESNQLSAHAWVSINNIIVMGGPVSGYEELIRTH